MPFFCGLAAIEALAVPAPAQARTFSIHIPAAPLPQALDRLLDGTGLDYIRLSDTAYRLVRRVPRPPSAGGPARPRPAPPAPVDGGDIVVTATKREEAIAALPIAISVVDAPDALRATGLAASEDVARQIDGLTLTSQGSGRNRQFIRGVADSPFTGASQSTVAILINDARVTYNAPDPDIRLVDVERVELLKGPQGSLYGSGTLGGVYRIVTRVPDLYDRGASLSADADMIAHGGAGGSVSAIVNLPLRDGALALRAVAYASREAGWIENGSVPDANRADVHGGRLALRGVAGDWTFDLSGAAQLQNVRDSQYVLADHALARPAQLAEPHDNDFLLASLRAAGPLWGADLVYSASWVAHEVQSDFDATSRAADFGLAGPALYTDRRRNALMNQEIRLSHGGDGGLSWLGGIAFMSARNRTDGTMRSSAGRTVLLAGVQSVRELAAFGDVRLPLRGGWEVGLGGRLFASWIEEEQGVVMPVEATIRRTGFSPTLSLSRRLSPRDFLYARYAGAVRPGGLSVDATAGAQHYRSDELATSELGWRHGNGGPLSFTATLFRTTWSHVQSDYLRDDGLIATRNAGNARIHGLEIGLDWRPGRAWTVQAGGTLQDSDLVRTFLIGAAQQGAHLPVVPDLTGRFSIAHDVSVAGWRGAATLRINYVGHSTLSFEPGLDRSMGNYVVASSGLDLRRGPWAIRLSIDNMLNDRSNRYGFGNPFSVTGQAQYTPLMPRRLGIGLSRSW